MSFPLLVIIFFHLRKDGFTNDRYVLKFLKDNQQYIERFEDGTNSYTSFRTFI